MAKNCLPSGRFVFSKNKNVLYFFVYCFQFVKIPCLNDVGRQGFIRGYKN